MKADGPRLDGAATSAGMEEGRAGRVLHLCRRARTPAGPRRTNSTRAALSAGLG